ncbi:MAG: hypothetical protein WCR55_12140, partial [Lentisphaerota bacterium]
MKKILLMLTLFFFSLCLLNANDPQAPSNNQPEKNQQLAADEAFKLKINGLINQRRLLSMNIYQQRVELINTDSNLRIMHQAIIDLHEKMAKQLNDNPKIVSLIDKGKDIDKAIA